MAEYKQLRYDVIGASLAGISEHPQRQMRKLWYEILGSVPQSIADCWWFTVKEFIEPLPDYLTKMEYSFKYWHTDYYKTCELGNVCYGSGGCKKEQVRYV